MLLSIFMRNAMYENFSKIKNIFASGLSFIYADNCIVCDKKNINSPNKFVCQKCLDRMPPAPAPDKIINALIQSIGDDRLAITEAYALFSSSEEVPFQKLIYGLKYHDFDSIGFVFGKMLARRLEIENAPRFDLIVPIPLNKAKLRERGYNQSDAIAKGLSGVLNVPFSTKIVRRKVYTKTQTKLGKLERNKNVQNIYEIIDKSAIKNLDILIVDDVLTTGSTINSLAELLLEEGARKASCATLMKA